MRHPVFEDGTVLALTCRAWGDLVAAWHNGRKKRRVSYARYAWE